MRVFQYSSGTNNPRSGEIGTVSGSSSRKADRILSRGVISPLIFPVLSVSEVYCQRLPYLFSEVLKEHVEERYAGEDWSMCVEDAYY